MHFLKKNTNVLTEEQRLKIQIVSVYFIKFYYSPF